MKKCIGKFLNQGDKLFIGNDKVIPYHIKQLLSIKRNNCFKEDTEALSFTITSPLWTIDKSSEEEVDFLINWHRKINSLEKNGGQVSLTSEWPNFTTLEAKVSLKSENGQEMCTFVDIATEACCIATCRYDDREWTDGIFFESDVNNFKLSGCVKNMDKDTFNAFIIILLSLLTKNTILNITNCSTEKHLGIMDTDMSYFVSYRYNCFCSQMVCGACKMFLCHCSLPVNNLDIIRKKIIPHIISERYHSISGGFIHHSLFQEFKRDFNRLGFGEFRRIACSIWSTENCQHSWVRVIINIPKTCCFQTQLSIKTRITIIVERKNALECNILGLNGFHEEEFANIKDIAIIIYTRTGDKKMLNQWSNVQSGTPVSYGHILDFLYTLCLLIEMQ